MDSLEKAVIRARSERTGAGRSDSTGDGALAAKSNRPRAAPGKRQPGAPAQIFYQNTRVQRVSEKVLQDNRLVAAGRSDSLADVYRILRAQVLQRLVSRRENTLGICSAAGGEGKTLTAANLAISLAMDPNHTVLLVDLDLRNPAVKHCFALDVEKGLGDYLEGKATVEECLVNPGIDRLVLFPAARPLPNASELLSSTRMVQLIGELQERYADRIVLYDLPPLLSGDAPLLMLPHIQASLLVIRDGRSQAGEVQRCLELLEDHQLVGTVLNDSVEHELYPYR